MLACVLGLLAGGVGLGGALVGEAFLGVIYSAMIVALRMEN